MMGAAARRAAPDRWLDRATDRFAAEGLRIGAARARALEVIARDATCLVTVQDLVRALRQDGGAGSQASVYRAVEHAHRLGLLRRELGADGAVRYEIVLPDEHHHHLVDDDSGEIVPFIDDDLEQALDQAARRLGVRMTSHEVRIRGVRP
ncbi:MAG: transcriptional repressor [Actinobacteria bacterium]|nr:transcriptional repressor [Actinomycetota bacterium]MBM3697894.1 transcriptional repressor [Actinomycetota bacterium]